MPDRAADTRQDGWNRVSLGELQVPGGIQGGPFGSQLHARDYVSNGIPLIMPKNIGENRLLPAGHDLITSQDAKRLQVHKVEIGDIVIGRKGDLSRRALIRESEQGWVCGTDCIRIRIDRGVVSPVYLSYYMGLQWVSNWLHRHDTGSTLPSLNTTNLARLPLLLPPRQYQDAVATILEGLDDKIAVNERIVAVADDLVRSFYVRESYGCHATIRIGDIGALVRDGVIADMIVGDENYIALEHMPRRNLWLSAWGTSAGVVSQKNRFLTGDVLFGKLRPYFHKVGVAFVNGTSSTDIFVIRPRVVTYRGWLLASLASDKVVEHASAVGDGTRMPRARWEDLANFEVPWIGDQRSRTFDDIVASLTNRVRAAVMESKVLADLRDTLLPGLMSGQIRVREAERIVEDVT